MPREKGRGGGREGDHQRGRKEELCGVFPGRFYAGRVSAYQWL